MRSKYSQFKVKKKSKSEFEFIGDLQVKPEFPLYTVSITYRGSLTPLVKVLSPELVSNPPHFYKQSQTLCLYHPDNYKWIKEKLVATDIVSWTAAWIYFYEVWLQKGIWYGPEALHTTTQKESE